MADDEVRIRAELEGALSRDLERAADSADDLADSGLKAAAALQVLDEAADDAGDELRDFSKDADSASRSTRDLGTQTRRTERDTKKLGGGFSKMRKIMGGVMGLKFDLSGVMKAYKIPVLVTMLSTLATGLSAVGAAGVGAVAGLAPLGGLIAAYPSVALAAAQGMQAFKLGTEGVSEAIQSLMTPGQDPKELAKQLKELHPEARQFAIEVAALQRGPIKRLKKDLQGRMFEGFNVFLDMAKNNLPTVTKGLQGTADVIGDLAKRAGEMVGSPMFTAMLGRIMETNNVVIRRGGTAAMNLAWALLHVVDAFRPVLKDMARYAEMGAKFLARTAQMGNESGKLTGFFRKAWRLAKDVGSVLWDVAVGFTNIMSAAKPMSGFLGRNIKKLAEGFREWTESAEGQQAITDWFKRGIPIIRQLAKVAWALAKAFGGLADNQAIVPMLKKVRKDLIPALESLAGGVIAAFGPALVDLATAFVTFQSALTFSPLAVILQAVADALLAVSNAVIKAPEPIRTMLSTLLLMSLGLKVVGFGFAGLAGAMSPLTGLFGGLTGKIAANADEMTGWQKVGAGMRTGMSNIKAGFTGVATSGGKLAKVMGLVGRAAKVMWLFMLGPVGLIIAAVLIVVGLGILLYKKWKPFRDFIDALWAAIKTGAVAAWNWVKGAAIAAWNVISAGAKIFWAIVKAVFSAFMTYARFVFTVIKTVVKIVWAIVGTIIATWWTFVVLPVLKQLWRFAKWVFGGIKKVVGVVFGFVKAFVVTQIRGIVIILKWFWGVFKWIWDKIKPFVLPIFRAVKDAFVTAFTKIRDFAKGVWERIKAAWGAVKGFFSGIWDSISSGATGAFDGVKETIQSVIDKVNGLIGGFNKLPGPNLPTIPNLFTGGPTRAGQKAVVGELGPEVHVGRSGRQTILGARGPEVRRFPEAGHVIPNHELPKVGAANRAVAGAPTAPVGPRSRPDGRGRRPGEGPEQMHLHFHGAGAPSRTEARAAAREAYSEWERQDRERRIRWGGDD